MAEKKTYFECSVAIDPAPLSTFGDAFICSSASGDNVEYFYKNVLSEQSNGRGKDICASLEDAAKKELVVRIYFDRNQQPWQVLDAQSMAQLSTAVLVLEKSFKGDLERQGGGGLSPVRTPEGR
jgi:hypothetical protein